MDQDGLVDAIKKAIDDALRDRLDRHRSDDPDYEERVAWVRSQIQREKDYHLLRRKIIEASLAWVIPLALGFLAISIFHELQDAILNWKPRG